MPRTNVGGVFFSYNFHFFSKFYCQKFGLYYKLLYICITNKDETVRSTQFYKQLQFIYRYGENKFNRGTEFRTHYLND